jgi:hypothetical protein
LKYYFTGRPCKHGHLVERYVSSGHCVECNKMHCVEWSKNNREKIRDKNRKWRAESPEKASESRRRWNEKNIERKREYNRKWSKENFVKRRKNSRQHNANRRAAKMQRTPLWANAEAIARVYNMARLAEAATGWPHHVDHIIPLQGKNVSGLHVEGNLQIIFDDDNLSKGNSWAT